MTHFTYFSPIVDVKILNIAAWLRQTLISHPCRYSPWMTRPPCTPSIVLHQMKTKWKWWKIWLSRLQPCVTHLRSTLQFVTTSMEASCKSLLKFLCKLIYLLILLFTMYLVGDQRRMLAWLKRSTAALLLTRLTTQAWERSGTN